MESRRYKIRKHIWDDDRFYPVDDTISDLVYDSEEAAWLVTAGLNFHEYVTYRVEEVEQ